MSDVPWPRRPTLTEVLAITPQPWAADALCAEIGLGDLWFPVGGKNQLAKSICRRCPVTLECLLYAVDHMEEYGIWGGLSADERRPLMGRNRRAH